MFSERGILDDVSNLRLFFFNDTATTEIYTLSLHDALPIFGALDAMTRDLLHDEVERLWRESGLTVMFVTHNVREAVRLRSEEHTSELQSRQYLVCRLLLEKKHK